MGKSWDGHAAMHMEDVQSALQIVQQCVVGLIVLLEDRITVATLRMDAKITEEYDHAANQVGFNVSLTDNMGNPKKRMILSI